MTDRYTHLLKGAASELPCATCLEVDGIVGDLPFDAFLETGISFFARLEEPLHRVAYWDRNESRPRRASLKTFMKRYGAEAPTIRTRFEFVAFSARGVEDDEISDAWTPRALFSVSDARESSSAFVYALRKFENSRSQFLEVLDAISAGRAYDAAHVFEFPMLFSPKAFAAGIGFSRNLRGTGELTERDKKRLERWLNRDRRKPPPPAGSLRDIFPLNVVGEQTLNYRVGGLRLEDWIHASPARGTLTRRGTKWLWEVPATSLVAVQGTLDKAGLLICGQG